jgi:hypothetical protein
MNKKGDRIVLNDVLDLYLASAENADSNILLDLIARYPQFEDELRECAAFKKRNETIPDRIYSDEEEQLIRARAVSAAQNVLYQKQVEGVGGVPGDETCVVVGGSPRRQPLPKPAATGRSVNRQKKKSGQSKTRARRHFARAVLSAEIVYKLHEERTFGRTKHQKVFHLCECIAQIDDIQGEYRREAAGPLDNRLIYSVEAELKQQKWFEAYDRESFGHAYRPLSNAGLHRKYLRRWSPKKQETIAKIIELMRSWDTETCEIFATAYAAWNDLIIWHKEASDGAILTEILERWHESKKRIPEQRWRRAISWMRKQGFVPTGFGQATTNRK